MKKRQNYSKRQVVQQLETRFKTIMIGCLSRFEAEFVALSIFAEFCEQELF